MWVLRRIDFQVWWWRFRALFVGRMALKSGVRTVAYSSAPNGCTGRCCQSFVMSSTWAEIQEDYRRWRKTGAWRFQEIEKVGAMLIPLGTYGPDEHPEGYTEEQLRCLGSSIARDRMVYTCMHFDRKTGLCGDYENRPGLCRRHPTDGRCGYGCGIQTSSDLVALEDVSKRLGSASKLRQVIEAEDS